MKSSFITICTKASCFHNMYFLQFWKLPNLVLVYSNNSYTTRLVLSRSSLSGLSSGHHNGSMYPACFRGRSLSLGRGWSCKLARLHSHHPQLLYISTLFFCFFSSKLQRKRPTLGKSVCKVFKMETVFIYFSIEHTRSNKKWCSKSFTTLIQFLIQ